VPRKRKAARGRGGGEVGQNITTRAKKSVEREKGRKGGNFLALIV